MGKLTFDAHSGWWIGRYTDSGGSRRRHRLSRNEKKARMMLIALEGNAILDSRLGIRPIKKVRFGPFVGQCRGFFRKEVRSHKRYEVSLDNLLACFGAQRWLTSIRPELIDAFKMRRREKVTAATVNRDLSVLRRLFNLAVNWGYARENPINKVRFFKESKGRVRYLTRDQFERVWEACRPTLRPLITVAVFTGLRLAELIGLRWGAVDLENGYVTVKDPKNNRPIQLPLSTSARTALTSIRLRNREWVFTNDSGKRLSPRTVQDQFKKVLLSVGIEDFRFHDLRHTFASWLAMAGENQQVIQELLRHGDIRMSDRYSHLMPGRTQQAVRNLDRFARRRPKAKGASESSASTVE